jgi:hypothetical protein
MFCRVATGGNSAAKVAPMAPLRTATPRPERDTDSDEDRSSTTSRPHANLVPGDKRRAASAGWAGRAATSWGTISLIGSDNIRRCPVCRPPRLLRSRPCRAESGRPVRCDARCARVRRWLLESAASVLRDIDRYYTDQRGEGDGAATQLFRQLSDPRPKDSSTTRELKRYKNLDSHWHESAVVATCRDVAAEMEKAKP